MKPFLRISGGAFTALIHPVSFNHPPNLRPKRGLNLGTIRPWLRHLSLVAAAALLICWGSDIALARNPDISFWTHNLSGDEPADETWTDSNNEIAVVGPTVHVVWTSQKYPTPETRWYYRRSLDGGQTFERKILLTSGPYADLNNGEVKRLAVDGNTVHVAGYFSTSDLPWHYEVIYVRSTNNGASFEPRRTLVRGTDGWRIYDTRVAADQGQVTIGYDYGPNWYPNSSVIILTSGDGGLNFTNSATVFNNQSEWGYTKLADLRRVGNLVSLVFHSGYRIGGTTAGAGQLYFAASTNGGTSFSVTKVSVPGMIFAGNWHDLTDATSDFHEKDDLAIAGDCQYAVWTGQDTNSVRCVFFARSINRGASFEATMNLSSGQLPPGVNVVAAQATVAAKGNYVYVVFTGSDGGIYLRRSNDGGQTFQNAQQLAALTTPSVEGGWWPVAAVDPVEPSGAKVHFFWTPNTRDIYRFSTDGGATVASPLVLTPGFSWPNLRPRNPQMAIGDDGAVHVAVFGAFRDYDDDIFHRSYRAAGPPGPTNLALRLITDTTVGAGWWGKYDNLQVPAGPDLNFTAALSAELWIKPATGAVRALTVLSKSQAGHRVGAYQLQTHDWGNARRPSAALRTDAGLTQLWGGEVIADDVWTHFALTYDANGGANNARLYVNGKLSTAATATGNVLTGPGPLWIGGYSSENSYPFHGEVDDIRLWNHALTADEIRLRCGGPLRGNEAGLVAYYPLDGTTRDATGRGNDGVLMYQETFVPGFSKTPVFTTPNLTGNLRGVPFAWEVLADFATGFTASGLPPGLALDGATGQLTGTPTTAGVFDSTITATNFAASATQTLRIIVRDPAGVLFREDFTSGLGAPWTTVPTDTSYFSYLPGLMRLRANNGDTYAQFNRPLNLFAINNPTGGDFAVTLALGQFVPMAVNYPAILITAWDDTDNNVRFGYNGNSGGPSLQFFGEVNRAMTGTGVATNFGASPILLRLTKTGNVYAGSWSTNGTQFLPFAGTVTNGDGTPLQIGFWMGVDPNQNNLALVDYFEVAALGPPVITQQPTSQSVVAGGTASFSVSASGTEPLLCQWLFNGAPLSGATAATLALNNVQLANAGQYRVIVSNESGSVTSQVATLTVYAPPSITSQPISQTISPGHSLTLTVQATGTAPLHYRWLLNGTDIPGAPDSPTLNIPNVTAEFAGQISVLVSNSYGAVTGLVATLGLVDLKMFAGVIIVAPVGSNYRIDYTPALADPPQWTVLTNVTLPSTPYVFIDFDSPTQAKRFYRAVAAP